MNVEIGRRVETVIRVLLFSEANPDDNPGITTVIAQLRENRIRAENLAAQQRLGITEVAAGTRSRRKLRADIHHNMVVPIARIGARAAIEEPGLESIFRAPGRSARSQEWRTGARGIATAAQERKELLLRHGLSEGMLTDLLAALDQYDAASTRRDNGKRAHVGATADLDEVIRDSMRLIGVLDGLFRYRFRDDTEKLAAWESARNVPTPANGSAPPPAEEPPLAPAA
jgi:hypothetical protein